MDVISDRIIDISLNVIGYLVAGGLGMLLHSAVQQRRLPKAAATQPAVESQAPAGAKAGVRQDYEFVHFGAQAPSEATGARLETGVTTNSAHRNRREILRLAREMLTAGTASDQIRSALPISQSELALLQNSNSN